MAKQQKHHVLDGEVLAPLEREVGVKLAGKVYVPAIPADARTVQGHNNYMQWHNHAVSLLDQYHAIREQYAANRKIIWRPSADAAAQEEEEAELKHQRKLAAKRRAQELIKADTEILLARQTLRAKKKFEPLKHAIGEERFKTEVARRKVGAAEARIAAAEASKSQAAEAESVGPSRAAMVSGLLEGVRAQLQEMRADDEDSEKRQELVADEASLERILAGLLKRGKN